MKILAYNGELHDRIIIMDNTVGSLTQLQRSIIIGSLLGDGYLRIVPGRRNAFLEINHSFSQKEYVDWKYKMLKNICKSGPKMRKGNGLRVAYRFTTRQMPELTFLHCKFYKSGTKTISDFFSLDPIMLAVWFMDDGSKCSEDNVYLNTQQFDFNSQQRCRLLLANLNIETTLNKDKKYMRIRIKKSSLKKFWKIITPFIVPSMTYKLNYNPVET